MRSLLASIALLAARPALGQAASAPPAAPAIDAAPVPSTAGPAAPREGGASTPAGRTPVVPTQALLDKLARGDRLFAAGDVRGALFAYQDAAYLQPGYAPAHVRLGRAYLALRYPDRAIGQAEAALAADPDDADARRLLEEARAAPPRPGASDPRPGATPPAR